jgi:hypothetical protein
MIGLSDLLRRYGEAIEADFQQYYRIDLFREAGRSIPWARIRRLVRSLPDDSRFVSAVAGDTPSGAGKGALPDVSGWPRRDRLLASIIDELAIANWQRGQGKGKRPDLLTAARRTAPRKLHAARERVAPEVMMRRLAAVYEGKGAR